MPVEKHCNLIYSKCTQEELTIVVLMLNQGDMWRSCLTFFHRQKTQEKCKLSSIQGVYCMLQQTRYHIVNIHSISFLIYRQRWRKGFEHYWFTYYFNSRPQKIEFEVLFLFQVLGFEIVWQSCNTLVESLCEILLNRFYLTRFVFNVSMSHR